MTGTDFRSLAKRLLVASEGLRAEAALCAIPASSLLIDAARHVDAALSFVNYEIATHPEACAVTHPHGVAEYPDPDDIAFRERVLSAQPTPLTRRTPEADAVAAEVARDLGLGKDMAVI